MTTKQIYDPIHGFIDITPLMQKIIDTHEFQRLRDLKQLGAVHYVYPSATHTRFEHSIGVSHLAGMMATHLFNDNTYPNDKENNNCTIAELAKLAGLIHDIGHGPFSHLYDSHVRHHNEPEHEKRGCEIFKKMVVKYNLPLTPSDVEVIIDMIDPPQTKMHKPMYQIVANKITQIDVDKIDYIQRDCYHIGLKFGGEWSRLIKDAIISTPPQQTRQHQRSQSNDHEQFSQIVWPKKLEYEILQLFSTRYRLHRQVYNHHTVKAYEYYISEILKEIRNQRPNIKFIDLTDSVVMSSLNANTKIKYYQNKIVTRNIPKLRAERILSEDEYKNIKDIPRPRRVLNSLYDVIIMGFSSGATNPLENIYVYNTIREVSRRANQRTTHQPTQRTTHQPTQRTIHQPTQHTNQTALTIRKVKKINLNMSFTAPTKHREIIWREYEVVV